MSSPVHALEAAALLLPPEERAELAERLIASLDRDPVVDAAWEEEIRRRVADFEAGVHESHPAADVIAEARERLEAYRSTITTPSTIPAHPSPSRPRSPCPVSTT